MVAETDTRRAEPTKGYYVYGIVPAGDRSPPRGVFGVDAKFPVTVLEHDGIAAITSEVSLDEFGEDSLTSNVSDLAWLEAKVRRHEGVLARFMGARALVPMRFCTIYRSEEHIRELLGRERASFAAALHHLSGKREWGVKSFVDTAVLGRWVEANDERARRLREEMGAKSAGGGYFARKRLEDLVRREREAAGASCARDSHALLSAASHEARANPLQRKDLSGHADEMLLNGAYLVEREREAYFHGLRDELESRYRALGVTFELTGPWPPYNFVPPELAHGGLEET